MRRGFGLRFVDEGRLLLIRRGRGKRSRHHPWRLDRASPSNDRARLGALSRSTPPPPIMRKPPFREVFFIGGGGSRPFRPQHPASAFRAGESALATIPGGSTVPRPQMIGRGSERFPVRLPPPPIMRKPPFREVFFIGGGGSRPFRPQHPASAFRAGESALATIPGGSTVPRPQMIGRGSERFPVRLPPPPIMRKPPFREVFFIGGGGSRPFRPQHPASAFRAGESALATIPGGSTVPRPQMIGRGSERFPVRLPHLPLCENLPFGRFSSLEVGGVEFNYLYSKEMQRYAEVEKGSVIGPFRSCRTMHQCAPESIGFRGYLLTYLLHGSG